MSNPLTQPGDDWLARIREAVEGLRYGTVQIVVHDGRIVQIDRTERFRYDAAAEKRRKAAAASPPDASS
ncbi:MAG: hypothetical protein BAA02_05725 [Paenibacillaceae bacterium ZCTH02-B3]|nr:MAG: hypothetical protein BAA02_05725 [Paenibacillaceae bacterium ZCTH02-B3]